MLKTHLTKAKNILLLLPIMVLAALNYGFGPEMDEQDWINWSNKCLTESYDPSADAGLKKWEITLTPSHFIRLRKTYQHGKQEYFSFSLKRFTALNYIKGFGVDTLELKTKADDIIVQTYEDPKGDIDSMSTMLSIPVKSILPERLDSLRNALIYFKEKTL